MSVTDKIANYYARGERPLTIEDIERVYETHPWLPRPQHIVMLDGDVLLPEGATAVGLTPAGESVMILTPLADEETVIHESIHLAGFGELAAYTLGPLLARKRFSLFRRRPVYSERGDSHQVMRYLAERYGLRPESMYPPPRLRHWVLTYRGSERLLNRRRIP